MKVSCVNWQHLMMVLVSSSRVPVRDMPVCVCVVFASLADILFAIVFFSEKRGNLECESSRR